MIQIAISGIAGRMGKSIAEIAMKDSGVEIAAAIEKKGDPAIGKREFGVIIASEAQEACRGVDCLIEFTCPEATLEHIEACRETGAAMVIGTTGLDAAQEEAIKKASETMPIVYSPNMAIGVNVLFKIAREAAKVLGGRFDIKVDETHHVHKKDSPSGTAKMIAKVIKEASGAEVPVEARREGEVVGNHGIVFDGKYEMLEIRHDAKSRDVFAAGAVEAAKFVAGKKSGLYSMADVLGL